VVLYWYRQRVDPIPRCVQPGACEGAVALHVELRAVLEHGPPLELVRSRLCGDLFDVIIELAGAGRLQDVIR
jgi:hypothetical protein